MPEHATYTRSLLRRFFAYAVDNTVAMAVGMLAFLLLAGVLGNGVRVSNGFVYLTRCEGPAQVFNSDGEPLSTSNFDEVEVCTSTTNFVFSDRKIRVTERKSGDGWKTERSMSLPVDDMNRLTYPIYIDPIYLLVLILGAAAFEASRLRATPGKLLFGLAVRAEKSDRAGFGATLIRNALKNTWMLYELAPGYLQASSVSYDKMIQNGKIVFQPDFWDQLTFNMFTVIAVYAIAIVMIVGLFLPWKTAGRALYDRIAGTFVVRTR